MSENVALIAASFAMVACSLAMTSTASATGTAAVSSNAILLDHGSHLVAYDPGSNRLVAISPPLAAGFYQTPAWRPDHRRIAYAYQRGTGRVSIYTSNPSGGDPIRVTTGQLDARPCWSPDGKRIAFEHGSHIAVVTLSTHRVHDTADGSFPAWSPDGRWIAFTGYHGDSVRIFEVHPNGSGLHPLTPRGVIASTPAWSPNGAYLAYATQSENGVPGYEVTGQLDLLKVSSGSSRAITMRHAGVTDALPTFASNGRRLAFERDRCEGGQGCQVHNRIGIITLSASFRVKSVRWGPYAADPSW
jgi:hypothetical protein